MGTPPEDVWPPRVAGQAVLAGPGAGSKRGGRSTMASSSVGAVVLFLGGWGQVGPGQGSTYTPATPVYRDTSCGQMHVVFASNISSPNHCAGLLMPSGFAPETAPYFTFGGPDRMCYTCTEHDVEYRYAYEGFSIFRTSDVQAVAPPPKDERSWWDEYWQSWWYPHPPPAPPAAPPPPPSPQPPPPSPSPPPAPPVSPNPPPAPAPPPPELPYGAIAWSKHCGTYWLFPDKENVRTAEDCARFAAQRGLQPYFSWSASTESCYACSEDQMRNGYSAPMTGYYIYDTSAFFEVPRSPSPPPSAPPHPPPSPPPPLGSGLLFPGYFCGDIHWPVTTQVRDPSDCAAAIAKEEDWKQKAAHFSWSKETQNCYACDLEQLGKCERALLSVRGLPVQTLTTAHQPAREQASAKE